MPFPSMSIVFFLVSCATALSTRALAELEALDSASEDSSESILRILWPCERQTPP